MNKKIYDKVADTSIIMNEYLKKLEACQKEKTKILSWIESLKKDGTLEEKQQEVEKKMNANIKKFEKIVYQIIKLNEQYKLS